MECWGELGEMVLKGAKSKSLIIAERKAESLGGVWVMNISRNIDLEVVTVASIINCVLADTDPPAWAPAMGPSALTPAHSPKQWESGSSQPRAGGAGLSDRGRDRDTRQSSAHPSQSQRRQISSLSFPASGGTFPSPCSKAGMCHRQVINVCEEPLWHWLVWLFLSQWVFMGTAPDSHYCHITIFPQ